MICFISCQRTDKFRNCSIGMNIVKEVLFTCQNFLKKTILIKAMSSSLKPFVFRMIAAFSRLMQFTIYPVKLVKAVIHTAIFYAKNSFIYFLRPALCSLCNPDSKVICYLKSKAFSCNKESCI